MEPKSAFTTATLIGCTLAVAVAVAVAEAEVVVVTCVTTISPG